MSGEAFRRHLGTWDAGALVVGTIVGSGIFLTPGLVAARLPSPAWLWAVWLLGGLTAFAGAAAYAELGAMMPRAGGSYLYLREAYGPALGRVYGWTLFAVLQTGSIAAIAAGFASYFLRLPPLSVRSVLIWVPGLEKAVAVTVILLLTAMLSLGLRAGPLAQNILTAAKVAALALVATLALSSGSAAAEPASAAVGMSLWQVMAGVGAAMVAVLWSYSGWWNLGYVAEELKEPRRSLPRAMAGGVAFVTGLYLLMNWAYLKALGFGGLQKSLAVAEEALSFMWGAGSGRLVSAMVCLSMLGALNGLMLMSPRAYFGMARDGGFAGFAARLHPQKGTPHVFLWLQAAWACLLSLWGGYETLFSYVMFAGFIFSAMGAAALPILRARMKGAAPPLLMPWAQPWMAWAFAAASSVLALHMLWRNPLESLAGLAVLAAGLFFHIRKK